MLHYFDIRKWPYGLWIVPIGLLLYLPMLGGSHLFDWDEINFAEIAREMIVTGDWLKLQMAYEPFYEKPPFFFWMQALSMKYFGISSFGARLPNALIGVITLWTLYTVGKRLQGNGFGMLWAMLYAVSMLPFLYFKSALIDPTFNLFIFLAIYFLAQMTESWEFVPSNRRKKRRFRAMRLCGLFMGLAILTKGPVALFLFSLVFVAYFIMSMFRRIVRLNEAIMMFVSMGFILGIWTLIYVQQEGWAFFGAFLKRHFELGSQADAGHGGFIGYHVLVLFVGTFPCAPLIFSAWKKREAYSALTQNFMLWMLITLFTVLVVFELVQTKIMHYSSLAYFPITYLASLRLWMIAKHKEVLLWWEISLLILLSLLFAVAMVLIYFIGNTPSLLWTNLTINDVFALDNLKASVVWPSSILWLSALFFIGMLVSLFMANRGPGKGAVIGIILSVSILAQSIVYLVVPRIEGYTQRAAIEIYKELAEKDVVVVTYGFKTYADHFYLKRNPEDIAHFEEINAATVNGLTVYVVTRSNVVQNKGVPSEWTFLENRNGFVLYEIPEEAFPNP